MYLCKKHDCAHETIHCPACELEEIISNKDDKIRTLERDLEILNNENS